MIARTMIAAADIADAIGRVFGREEPLLLGYMLIAAALFVDRALVWFSGEPGSAMP